MALDKTKTTRKRSITIYPSAQEIKEKWFEIAKKEGLSVSNFVIEVVEEYIQQKEGFSSKNELSKNLKSLTEQNERLREENIELSKKVDILNLLADRYENQLTEYKNKTFIENGKFEGVREYQQNLIELFKQKSSIGEDEVVDLLHINPHDVETLKAISKQIELLQDFGVVEKIRGGWRWKR